MITRQKAYRTWDLGWTAFCGVLVGVMYSFREVRTSGTIAGALTNEEIILTMAGRLSALALLFAAIALARNFISWTLWKRSNKGQ